jgi:hypothetical protein
MEKKVETDHFVELTEEFVEFTEDVFRNIRINVSEFFYWTYLSWNEMVKNARPVFDKQMILLFWNLLRIYDWMKSNIFEPVSVLMDRKIPSHQRLIEPTIYPKWKSVSCLYKKTSNLSMVSYLDEIIDFFVDIQEQKKK